MRKLSLKRKQYLDKWSRVLPGAKRKLVASTRIRPTFEQRHPGEFFAPSQFNIGNARSRRELLRFISDFRQCFAKESPQAIILDFSATEKLFPDGTLLFLAELRRMMRHTKGRHSIRCVLPSNDKVCQVFEQIGLWNLLGVKSPAVPKDDDVVHWRFAHGHQVEGQRYEDVLSDFDGEIAPDIQESLFKGITEAMTNVINHAYLLERQDGCGLEHEKEWWMFSQLKDDLLIVVFCDLGAGIPRTLPLQRKELWAKLTRNGRASDSSAIENAVKDSTSRTGLHHRGKGLNQIYSTATENPGSEVAVFSNFGAFGRSKTGKVVRINYDGSIMGTLIHWNIPLQPKEQQ